MKIALQRKCLFRELLVPQYLAAPMETEPLDLPLSSTAETKPPDSPYLIH